MVDALDRRKFIKYSTVMGAMMLAGDALLSSAGAQEQAKPIEVDQLKVWVVVDNYYDALRKDIPSSNRFRVVPGKTIHAEHGLSYYVETVVGGKASSFMFDYGLDPQGVMNNLAMLGLDLGQAKAFCLSHGHFDHYMALLDILKKNQAKIAKGTPFYVGEEGFAHRYSLRPGTSEAADLGQLRQKDLEDLGLKVVEIKAPTQIIPGAYSTGSIPRLTAYEQTSPTLLVKRGEKSEPDDFRGEQALWFKVKGKGLVVLSGCAHAGIVNTVRHAQMLAGTDQLLAVIGGFHLINAKPEKIESTVADIKAMKPAHIVPTHCTGFEAIETFKQQMSKEFFLNTAGTLYTFAG